MSTENILHIVQWVLGLSITLLLALLGAIWVGGVWVGGMKEWKKGVNDKLKDIFDRLPPKATRGKSPLALTEFGKSISKELGAEAWAEKEVEKEPFFSLQRKPEYEIHRFCADYVRKREFSNTDIYTGKMLSCAYDHGTTINEVEDTLAVVLRDAVLALKLKMHKYKSTEWE